jgi:fatty-acyl-CoA synthase
MATAVFASELTPLRFLSRAAQVHPDKIAIVHGERRMTYRDMAAEATRLAHALARAGVGPGDRVAYLAPNTPPMLVAHFGVPLAGAALVAINTRLAPDEVRYICDHAQAKILVVDAELHPTVEGIRDRLQTVQQIVTIVDDQAGPPAQPLFESTPYEALLAGGSDEPLPWTVEDELAVIAINYTSGTTGKPKGVMYSHRGAYLNALGEVIHSAYDPDSVYLWTLPMFHCNGWCTTWGVTAVAGRHVCLRAVRADDMWRLLEQEGVTHFSGAPVVLTTFARAPQARRLARPITITTAGAPPSPTTIAEIEALDGRVIHVYGLTETYGPYAVCERQRSWDDLPQDERAALLARQGVGMVQAEDMRVVDEQMRDVPRDGTTIGEIVMRGNNVMLGYLDDPAGTAQAFRGGWFHSGDLGVMEADGYVRLVDRSKDVVISGGENISTVEVEQALMSHPAIEAVAVVGVPDDAWGERPKAFVVLSAGASATEAELIDHVRGRIARYKAPKAVEFLGELPTTSTGKVQKFALREREWAGHRDRIQG